MWICLTDCFVSVVRYLPGEGDDRTQHVLVRARLTGDLERLLGESVEVSESAAADYRFRAIVHQDTLFSALVRRVTAMAYGNFKNAVDAQSLRSDPFRDLRHGAYSRGWGVFADMQRAVHGEPWAARAFDGGPLLEGVYEGDAGERDCEDCGEPPGFCLCWTGADVDALGRLPFVCQGCGRKLYTADADGQCPHCDEVIEAGASAGGGR